jgi:hypothetical protein
MDRDEPKDAITVSMTCDHESNTLFTGFRYRYPQEFLDSLAKEFGFTWTKVEWRSVPRDTVCVCPPPPPTGILYYLEPVYDKKTEDK